jgi:TM2 domain-containing membrane protein YozV
MPTQIVNCPKCASQNSTFDNSCRNCGFSLFQPNHVPNYGNLQNTHKPPGADKRIAAGICGILLGGLGVHKFILGYKNEGIIMLVGYLVGILLCGIPSLVFAIIGIVEGIMYLTKSDEEFAQIYIIGRKPWF